MTAPRPIPPQAVDIVKRYEGFSPYPYKDAKGILTVGWGHVVIPGERFTEISQAQGLDLLMNDLQLRAGWIPNHIHVPLNDNQFSALLSLVFNEGTAPLDGHLGRYVNEGQIQEAADEFSRWVYCDHRKLPGLVKRREAERELFLRPVE